MRILYHGPSRKDESLEHELNAKFVSKDQLLTESDILTLHCPLTDETRHAFGAAEFRAMKPTAVFVNTTRGPSSTSLPSPTPCSTVKSPPQGSTSSSTSPKSIRSSFSAKTRFSFPHGQRNTATRTRMAEIAATNILARLAGRVPPNCVNPDYADHL